MLEHPAEREALGRAARAEAVAAEVGIDEVIAEVLPGQKADKVEEVQKRGLIVAMTGDGVNDGPALKASHIGISMGKKGSEIARQASSLILVEDDLKRRLSDIIYAVKTKDNEVLQLHKRAFSLICTGRVSKDH